MVATDDLTLDSSFSLLFLWVPLCSVCVGVSVCVGLETPTKIHQRDVNRFQWGGAAREIDGQIRPTIYGASFVFGSALTRSFGAVRALPFGPLFDSSVICLVSEPFFRALFFFSRATHFIFSSGWMDAGGGGGGGGQGGRGGLCSSIQNHFRGVLISGMDDLSWFQSSFSALSVQVTAL